MRAGRLDAEDRRILCDGSLGALTRFRGGWAFAPRGPFHHGVRIDALIRAGLMTRSVEGGRTFVWTTQAGRDAAAGYDRLEAPALEERRA